MGVASTPTAPVGEYSRMWPLVALVIAGTVGFFLSEDRSTADFPPINFKKGQKRRSRMKTTPRTFISFDFDHDETSKKLFAGQAKNSKTPFDIADWSSKSALPESKWEAEIRDKVGRCHIMVVLVGRSMGSATGVVKEIKMANANNVPVFGVYIDGATETSTLPSGLPRNRVIKWTWDGIASAIDQLMNEGKNKAA